MNTQQPQRPSQGKSRYLSAAVSAILTFAAAGAYADPRNGVVTNGNATISTPELNLTQIDQHSHSASIDWQSFDVAAQERVVFNQPSASSVALNRILTQDPSQIYGSLSANGRVFLINPNGIIFGASARINVGSLVASSLDLTTADIDAGHFTFDAASGRAGAIVNSGQITASNGGSVTLLGQSVRNNGLIVANYGSVNLGAGRAATLDFAGDGLVRFQIDEGLLADSSGVAASVENAGQIVADGGQVLLTARQANDVIARAVNNDGVIRAARVENVGGRIRLVGTEGSVVNNGTLDASGVGATSTGGEVQVLGTQVQLSATSIIDASGSAGGGAVFVGGSFGGADPAILNSQRTEVQTGAVIHADSLASGDAGRVAVWSDGTTSFNGDILARASGASGDGGQAEVSGHEHLQIGGHAWLQSAYGDAGTLFLDPGSITIVSGPDTSPPNSNDILTDGWVIGQLGGGSNVTILTNSSHNNDPEDLVVQSGANISWANANSLTLRGDNSLALALGSHIENTGTGSLTLRSTNGGVTINGTVTMAGDLTVTAGGSIAATGSLVIGGDSTFTVGIGRTLQLNGNNTFTGAVHFDETAGDWQNVTLRDSDGLTLEALTIGGDLVVEAGGDIQQSGPLQVGGSSSFTTANGRSILLGDVNNAFDDASSLTLAASGGGTLANVTLRDSTQLLLPALTISGNLVATSDVFLGQSGTLHIGGAATLTSHAGRSIVLADPNNSFTGDVTFVGESGNLLNVSLSDTTALQLRPLSITGNLTIAAFSISQFGLDAANALHVGQDASFTASGGQSIALANLDNSFGGDLTIAARASTGNLQNVSLASTTGIDLNPLALNGDLTISTRGAISQSGALTVSGNSSFTAGSGADISLGNNGNTFSGPVFSVGANSGRLNNLTVHDQSILDLAALDLDGSLDLSAAALSQSGAWIVRGDADLAANAGQSIFLNLANQFDRNGLGTTVTFAANTAGLLQNVALNNLGDIDLQALTLNGSLALTATGSIRQSGAWVVAQATNLTAGNGQSVILNNGANSFTGAVTVAAGGAGNTLNDVTLTDTTELDLQALTISGDLTVAAAEITQSGPLNVGLTSSFTAAAGRSILLGNAGNSFNGAVDFAASGVGILENVTISDSNALQLHALTIHGDLDARASALTQSGALVVGDDATFTAAAGQSVLLGTAGNSFGGDVVVAASGVGNLLDVTLHDSTALQILGLTIDRDLNLSSGADLSAGALVVGGKSVFTAGSGASITLNNQGNSFTDTVSFAAAGAGNLLNVDVFDATALDLRALSLGGTLNVVSGGAITQSGALSTVGAASFTTRNDAGAAITLDGTNSFGSVQAAVRNSANTADAAANIVIHESDATSLGNVRTAGGQSVSIVSGGAIAALGGTAVNTGNLSLVAGGDIGTVGTPISFVSANGSLTAVSPGSVRVTHSGGPGSNLALTQAVAGNAGVIGISSDGTIRVADVRAGGAVSLTSTGGNILDDNANGAGSQIVGTAVTLQATGAIGEANGVGNGNLDIQASSIAATAQGGGLYLDQAQGDMNLRQLSAAGPISLTAAAGSIVDDATDASAASIASAAGGITLLAANNIGTVTDVATRQGTALAINTNGGTLTAQVGSATGQVNLGIAGGSGLSAGPGAIAAGGSGRLLIQSTGDLSLSAFSGAITGFSEVGFSSDATLFLPNQQSAFTSGSLNTLFVRGATDVVRTGRVYDLAAGRLIFESGGAGGDVTLNTAVGRIDATVGNGANVTINQTASDLVVGTVATTGNIAISAANLLDDGDPNGVTRISAGGAVSLQATGNIGSADGSGGGRIDTAGNSVALVASGGSVFLSHLGDLLISGGVSGGSVDVAAATGSITVGASLQAAGPVTLDAGTDGGATGNITLSGAVQTGSTATLIARGGGTLADGDDLVTHLIANEANLTAGTIGFQANALNLDVGALSANASGNIYVRAANGLQLRSISGTNVVMSAVGSISDDGDAQTRITADTLNLTATAIGAPGAGNEIDTAVNRLSATASAGGIYVGQTGSVELGTLTASGGGNDIAIAASGAITDDGDNTTRISGGNLVLSATSIGTTAAGGELDTQVASLSATTSAGGIRIGEADDLQLNAINAGSGDISLSAAGALSDDGVATTRIAGANVALSATRLGTDAARISTAVDTLSATASNGGIFVEEADSVILADVRTAGAGNTVNLRTGNNGNIIVQSLVTQGGAVNLTAGGTGSLNVTGSLESNNGVVNLISGNAIAVPGLNTGTGSAVLHTVNDVNVGTISAGSISITSDTGNVMLGTANAGTGNVTITANNGSITDNTATSVTAGQATLSARSIGSADNPLNVAIGTLTANTTAGGVFIDDSLGLTVTSINAAGAVALRSSGAFVQLGSITSTTGGISLQASSIDMDAGALTTSNGGQIAYIANADDATVSSLDAGSGRVLLIAADSVFSSLGAVSTVNNLTGSAVEVRAGGLNGGTGEIGTRDRPLGIGTPQGVGRSVFLIVPAANGIQRSTPRISFTGSSAALLLKGYTGSAGTLLFDLGSTFTPDTVLLSGESIVPLLNGRVAVNTDSLSAAKQALSSGVISRVNIDWAAFDPNVSLFGTVDPALRLPSDQLDEPVPSASLFPPGSVLTLTSNQEEDR